MYVCACISVFTLVNKNKIIKYDKSNLFFYISRNNKKNTPKINPCFDINRLTRKLSKNFENFDVYSAVLAALCLN